MGEMLEAHIPCTDFVLGHASAYVIIESFDFVRRHDGI